MIRPSQPLRDPAVVLKLGGAALADGERVRGACDLVRARGGGRCVLVVSAALGVTDALERAARAAVDGAVDLAPLRLRHRALLRELALDPELADRHLAELALVLEGIAARGALEPPARDHALSLGERLCARIVAAALKRAGLPALPLDAGDLGLLTDSSHGRARPLPESLARVGGALRRLLDQGHLPVVTGFLATDAAGRLTTLGRDGSDLTAALVAAALPARGLELWKAVGGVLGADPALVPDARVLPRMDYGQAAALAALGAKVLHPDALAPLASAGVPARVLGFAEPLAGGTRIGTEAAAEPYAVVARSGANGAARLALAGGERLASDAGRVLAGESLDAVALSPLHGAARFEVPQRDLQRAARRLHARFVAVAAASDLEAAPAPPA